MRVQYGVEAIDAISKSLVAKVRRCIDEDAFATQPQKNGGTKALIPRIAGRTNFTAAADHGHAHAGSRAEHKNRCVLELVEHLLGLGSLTTVGRDDARALISGSAGRLNSRSFFQLIRDLDEAEPKLGQPVLDKPLLLDGEIALRLL